MAGDATRTTINELLDAARRRLRRLEPQQACDAMAGGAVLIDIRSEHQRERDGVYRARILSRAMPWSGVSTQRPDTAIRPWAKASTAS